MSAVAGLLDDGAWTLDENDKRWFEQRACRMKHES